MKVHGSRVIAATPGTAPRTEPFEEQTTTMIVFPQGGVLRMNTSVGVGQMLVLTNSKSKQDAICRVLKVRSFPNMQAYVEVEFTHAQPGYWGVYFPAEASGSGSAASKAVPSAATPPSAPTQSEPKQKTTPETSRPVAPPPKPVEPVTQAKETKTVIPAPPVPPAAPAKPVSPFISIGSKEEVLASADSTRETKTNRETKTKLVAETIQKEIRAAEPAKPAAEEPPAPATALSIEELRGDEDAISSVLASLDAETSAGSDSKIIEASKSAAREAAGEAFGVRLDLGVGTKASQGAEAGQNWAMIVACAAVLVLAVGGGIFYFRMKPANLQPSQTPTSAQSVAAPQSSTPNTTQQAVRQTPATQPFQPSSAPPNPAPVRTNAAPPSVASSNSPRSSRTVAAPAPVPVQPTATVVAEQQQTQNTTPAQSTAPNPLAAAMDAHPVSSQRPVTQNEAPSLDPGAGSASQPDALLGIGSGSAAAPAPPEPVSDAPQRVGGKVQQPRLISSVMPIYPSVAKQAHVEGDVVVDTQIDKNGNVVHMKAVSGPVALRQAAVDAVRRWKYQPSTLDGQPVPVEMLVTVKFRL